MRSMHEAMELLEGLSVRRKLYCYLVLVCPEMQVKTIQDITDAEYRKAVAGKPYVDTALEWLGSLGLGGEDRVFQVRAGAISRMSLWRWGRTLVEEGVKEGVTRLSRLLDLGRGMRVLRAVGREILSDWSHFDDVLSKVDNSFATRLTSQIDWEALGI
jgi:hypothetical protein